MLRASLITITSVLLLASLIEPLSALSEPQRVLHSFEKQGSILRVTGEDPYIITKPYREPGKPSYLLLDLRVNGTAATNSPVRMEVFFKPKIESGAPVSTISQFDARYRVQFSVDRDTLANGKTPLLVALPESSDSSEPSIVRIDIDACSDCSIEFLSHPKFFSEPLNNIAVIEPTRVLNGVITVPDSGLPISVENWQLHDLERQQSGLSATGNDPYLVSPYLDLETANLGGVLVTLVNPPIDFAALDFQLFYATAAHGFVETATVYTRVQYSVGSELSFVLPLAYLSQQPPAINVVDRIRLDFPTIEQGHWEIAEISILSKQQLQEQETRVSPYTIERKSQSPSSTQLVRQSLLKVFSDSGFVLSYLILLLITVAVFWRSFRR